MTFLVPTVGPLVPWLDALVLLEIVVLLAAFAVAVLRDQITGAQVVVRRSLTYGLLTGLLAAAFAGVVAALSSVSNDRSTDLIASVVTALLALPLRDRLQGVVDRAIYGERSDPFAALDRLGQRMDSADPESVLVGVAEAVATILRLPSVRVAVGDEVVAFVGPEVESWTRLPLRHGGEEVGALLVAPRAGQAALDPRDVRMLEALQRQAGSAVASVRLSIELQQSRQRIVAAREEERRRLRRDLHDGLGPTLAGIGLGLEVAQATQDPAGCGRAARRASRRRPRLRCWTYDGWSRTCDRPPSTSSAWSARCAGTPIGSTLGETQVDVVAARRAVAVCRPPSR